MTAQRYLTKEKAAFEVYGRPGTVIADLKNLSQSGALLEWDQNGVAMLKGDLVRVTVYLRALNRRHNLNAEVMWTEGNRSGVQFISSDQVLTKMVDKT